MSKELEALNLIRENLANKTFHFNLVECLDIIENGIKRLVDIEKVEPSEFMMCFKRIKNLLVCIDYEKDIVKSVNEILPRSCYKVEQALQRLDKIDNANSNEALEDLKCLKSHINARDMLDETSKKIALDICNDIEKVLLKAQEDEKLLDIERKSSIKAQEILGDYAILKKQYCKVVDELLEKQNVFDALKNHLHILPMSDGNNVIAIGCPSNEDVIEPNDFGYAIIMEWLLNG